MATFGVRCAAVLLVGAGLAASAPVASAAPVPTPLAGTKWRLESSGFARTAPVKYTGVPAYFSINGTQAGGNDGCNVFGVDARTSGERVEFGHLISTMRACLRPGAGRLFADAFKGVRTVRVTGDRLQVSDGPRGYWNFVAAGPAKR